MRRWGKHEKYPQIVPEAARFALLRVPRGIIPLQQSHVLCTCDQPARILQIPARRCRSLLQQSSVRLADS